MDERTPDERGSEPGRSAGHTRSGTRPAGRWRVVVARLLAVLLVAAPLTMGANRAAAVENLPGTTLDTPQSLFAYVAAGELVDVLFTKVDSGAPGGPVTITLQRPGAAAATCDIPSGAAVGTVCQWTDQVAPQTGIWEIQHTSSPDSAVSWSVDVHDGTTVIPGRVWSTGHTVRQAAADDVTLWYRGEHGHLYESTFHGIDGQATTFRADVVGVRAPGTCLSTYRSVAATDPAGSLAAADECGAPYKVFFEPPALDLPATATSWDGTTTWVNPAVATPSITDAAFTPDTPGSRSGSIDVVVSGFTGQLTVQVDADHDGVFDGPADVALPGWATDGAASVAFDGLDGEGDALPVTRAITARVLSDRTAEIHLVADDVELLAGGVELTLLNGPDPGRSTLHWDDTGLAASACGTQPAVVDGSAGVASDGGVHGWDAAGCPPDMAGSWGDDRLIDHWAHLPVDVSTDLEVPGALPQLVKAFGPDEIPVHGRSTLTITVENTADRLAAAGWSFTDSLPAGVTVAEPALAGTTCANGTVTASAGGSTIDATGDLLADQVSCTVTVAVTAAVAGTYQNCAGNITASSGVSPPACASLTCNDNDVSGLPDFFVDCTVPAEPKAVDFEIQERWRSGNITLAYQTPLVGDLYGTGVPVAVVAGNLSYSAGAGVPTRLAAGLRIVRASDGALLDTISTPRFAWSGHAVTALADIDGDGTGEIILKASNSGTVPIEHRGRLIAYGYDSASASWAQRWVSDQRYDNAEANGRGGANLAVADFNADGTPEVFVGNQIFNARTGVRLAAGASAGSAGCARRSGVGCFWGQTAAVDMDDDGDLELVAGDVVYDVTIADPDGETGNSLTVAAQADPDLVGVGDGWTAVADMDLDGRPDVVVARMGIPTNSDAMVVYVWDGRTGHVSSLLTGIGTGGGAPMIGDIDGDGAPEIVVQNGRLRAFDYVIGSGLSVKWNIATTDTSAQTSLTMFDFNNDGRQELVYRDETHLRIIDGAGATASNLATFPCASNTGTEMPVIADIDGSGEARILVTCDTSGTVNQAQLRAFESASDPWSSTRPVWNQQAYFATHVNDDLTIPAAQAQHWMAFDDAAQQCSNGVSRPFNSFQQQMTDLDPDTGCPVICDPLIDYADAPAGYGTTSAGDGARHLVDDFDRSTDTSPLMLGTSIDLESDGMPSSGADGDDHDGIDDEDGVDEPIVARQGRSTPVTVTATNTTGAPATLAAWMDLDGDGTFEASERPTPITVPAGTTDGSFVVTFPPTTATTDTYVRLRLLPGVVADPQPIGLATAGEVEDHPVVRAAFEVTKDLVSTIANGDGTYTLRYDLAVARVGTDATYDLDDDLMLGDAVTVQSVVAANVAPGTIPTNDDFDGDTDPMIAEDVAITAGTTHRYSVEVVVSVDPAEVTPANSDCVLDVGETGTGAMNRASVESDGDSVSDVACQHFPGVAITKEIMGDPTPTGVAGEYRVTYRLTVQNSGSAQTDYDLDDELRFGADVTVVDAEVAATLPGTLTTNPGWNGRSDTTLATGVSIGGAAAGAVVEHVYTVTVVVATASTLTSAAADCSLQPGESGTGVSNTAVVTGDWGEALDDACAPLPITTIDKSLTEVTPGPDGAYTLTYRIAVRRTGTGPTYRLEDTFAFGDAVTVEHVGVTPPSGLSSNPGFDGASDTLIVDGASIADGATHVYIVTVEVSVDAAAVTFDNTDCTIGGTETGSGFSNAAAMTTNGVASSGTACAPVPAQLSITKTVGAGSPIAAGDGTYQVGYTITVTNGSAGPGSYDLSDELAFGDGIDVISADLANLTPGTIVVSGWDGVDDTEVVSGQSILGAAATGPTVHVYTVTVLVDVPAELATTAADCTIDVDESGSGLTNRASLEAGTARSEAAACAPLPVTTFEKRVVTVVPGGDGTHVATYELTVERTGDGPAYSLSDTIRFGAAATVVDVTATAATPGPLLNPDFDGVGDTSLVVDQPIADGESHVVTVTVVADVDPAAVTPTNSDCALSGAETGTGFLNTASLTTNGTAIDDVGCTSTPGITVAKAVADGPTPISGGRHRMSYTLTVTNTGAGPGTYALQDELTFGVGITVEQANVVNDTPGGNPANPSWTGTAAGDLSIIGPEPIAGAGSSDGTVHRFTVSVVASVPFDIDDAAADCSITGSESGTGLRNTAALQSDSGVGTTEACGHAPTDEALHVAKSVSDTAVSLGGTLRYTVTVTNTGDVAYTADHPASVVDDLSDVLDDATWVGDATTDTGAVAFAAPRLSWSGPLAVGERATITYSVRVEATVTGNLALRNTVATDAADANCPEGDLAPECATLTRVEVSPQMSTAPGGPTGSDAPSGTGGAGALAFTGGHLGSSLRLGVLAIGLGSLLALVSTRGRRTVTDAPGPS